jgi:hypothetical protein
VGKVQERGATMANQTFNLGYEREWERRRNLQHAVLFPLIERDSTKWGNLHNRILVESDGTAKVAALGMEQLSGGE